MRARIASACAVFRRRASDSSSDRSLSLRTISGAPRRWQVAVGGLDRAVLVGDAAVVAAGGHAVVVAERSVADGPVLIHLRCEIAERRGEAVAPMLARRAAERPERVLETRGERHEALAAGHDMSMLEAAEGEAEVIPSPRTRGESRAVSGRSLLGCMAGIAGHAPRRIRRQNHRR